MLSPTVTRKFVELSLCVFVALMLMLRPAQKAGTQAADSVVEVAGAQAGRGWRRLHAVTGACRLSMLETSPSSTQVPRHADHAPQRFHAAAGDWGLGWRRCSSTAWSSVVAA
jgi:hypothetical protein